MTRQIVGGNQSAIFGAGFFITNVLEHTYIKHFFFLEGGLNPIKSTMNSKMLKTYLEF